MSQFMDLHQILQVQGIVNPIAMILSVAMMFEYSLNNIKVSNIIKEFYRKST